MSQKNTITSLDVEAAYEAVEVLTEKDVHLADGCEVYRGIHPQWGPTVLIFPAFGDPINVPMSGFSGAIPLPPIQPEVTVIKNADEQLGKTL